MFYNKIFDVLYNIYHTESLYVVLWRYSENHRLERILEIVVKIT